MMNRQPEKEKSSAAFLVIALFILVPPLGILAAIALAVYSKSKKTPAAGSRPARPAGIGGTPARPNAAHGHTPETYSYDGCAVEKRLEQLDALKKAGLMEREEYEKFRQKIVNGA